MKQFIGKAKVFYTLWNAKENEDGSLQCTFVKNVAKSEEKLQENYSTLEVVPCLNGAKELTIKKGQNGYEVIGEAPKTVGTKKVKVAEIPAEFADMPIVLGKGKVMYIAFAKDESNETEVKYYNLGNAGKTEETARAKYPTAHENVDETLSGGKVIVRKYNEDGTFTQLSEKQIEKAEKEAQKAAKAAADKAGQTEETEKTDVESAVVA